MKQNIYNILSRVEIISLPTLLRSANEINLFGEDSETTGLELLLSNKTKNIGEASKNFSIITTGIASILTGIVAFPENLAFNPRLESIIESDYFGLIWIGSILLAAILWLRFTIKK